MQFTKFCEAPCEIEKRQGGGRHVSPLKRKRQMKFEHSDQEPKIAPDGQWLESCELFAGLPRSVQVEVMDSATKRSYARRERMFSAGDRIEKVLLLVEGCVKLTQTTEGGSEVILRFHGPGEAVGMPDWVPGDVHFYTAQALDVCSVLVWNARTMQAAKERFPQLQRNVNKMIGRALNKLQTRYCALMTGEVTSRLAQGVAHLLEEIGQQVNSHVEICLSQEELGQMTAVSPWAVCRELCKWEREGLVRLRREVIEVQNVPGLLSLCRVN
jgi:CRP/FNR family transcriptional regulator, nitrogen oxide reductase regulator